MSSDALIPANLVFDRRRHEAQAKTAFVNEPDEFYPLEAVPALHSGDGPTLLNTDTGITQKVQLD